MTEDTPNAARGDLRWQTTPHLLELVAERLGDQPAVVDGDVTLTFGDLAGRAHDVARSFLAAGLERGDRVAIWAPNMWEWVVAVLGLQVAGGVLVPLNTRYKGVEAAYVLERSRARFLFTVSDFLGNDYVRLLQAAEVDLPHLEQIVVLRGGAPEGARTWDAFLADGAGVDDRAVRERAASVSPDDVSDILFTSGTTGAPKGVMTTHGQNLRAFQSWADLVDLREGDRYLVVNPYFHSFGYKAGILASLIKGATMYPQPVFDVPTVLEQIQRDRITMFPGAPTLYQSILNHPDRASYDLSSLRLVVTGAAAIPVELILRMRDELTIESIITAYGLTETCGVVTACEADDDPETIATTSGRAIPDVELRCVDEAGASVPAGEPGEVVVRGYNVMVGYFDDPGATAEAIDADGWLHTGDVGVLDERGYLRITDRTKDMFIVGGFNAYPAEIENLMLAHEAIAQVAVIGVPDERLGEVGMAFVVLRPGATASADDLVAWARDRMANYKAPRTIEILDELPLNATGKVLKFELRDRAAATGA
jgi:acyl-CoA synthetase (AMP-forming)/AMP-acid ligase II